MSEQQPGSASGPDPADVPDVAVGTSRWPSVVWLIPIVAGLIAAWLVYSTLSQEGATITIKFQSAEGLEAGKTLIKYKDVTIGMVEKVSLSEDLSEVLVVASMHRDVSHHLTDTARFWIVVPRLTLRGVSGLGTIVSGAYIEMDPGKGGKEQKVFEGLSEAPPIKSGTLGKAFVLTAKQLGSVSRGAPVLYRGVEVGEVLKHEFSADQQTILIDIFVRSPHDKLVRKNSRFWNVSGFDVSIGATGVQLKTESLQNLILGGVEFDTPELLVEAAESKAGARFPLFKSKRDVIEAAYTERARYISYFDGSVRGLTVGAPVEFRGIKVGSVVDLRLEFDPDTNDLDIPVLFEIQPERVAILRGSSTESVEDRSLRLQALIKRGLRAQLQTASFLTGQLFIELDFHPDTPIRTVKHDDRYLEIPTIPRNLDEITTSITQLVKKIEKLPIDKLADGMLRTVDGADKLVNSPELQESVVQLHETIKNLDSLVKRVDKKMAPEAEALVKEARSAVESVNDMVSDKSSLRYDLTTLLRELSLAARSIRSLASYLERNPNALIYGKRAPRGQNR
ncbi:MAG: MlaD family protein [Alphaproteobacteria bacterium]|nr:MlaD family protein [Alphaproteobacteria bacterium]